MNLSLVGAHSTANRRRPAIEATAKMSGPTLAPDPYSRTALSGAGGNGKTPKYINSRKREVVRTAGLEPALPGDADFRTTSAFAAPVPRTAFVVWTIPSPCPRGGPRGFRRRPSSLYTFLRRPRRAPLAFPDSARVYAGGFPPGTPIEVCCVYRFRHVRLGHAAPDSARPCLLARFPAERNCPDDQERARARKPDRDGVAEARAGCYPGAPRAMGGWNDQPMSQGK